MQVTRRRVLALSASAAAAIGSAAVAAIGSAPASAIGSAPAAAIGTAPAAAIASLEATGTPPASASTAGHYSGLTSQHLPISFTLASGHVSKLSFWVRMSCASHHLYRDRVFRFAPIPIAKGRFHKAVSSAHPAASATVRGRVVGRRVSGMLTLRRYIRAEHGYCAGTSTFSLKAPARTHANLRPQRPGTTI